ncbi:MAG: HAD hydrolase family protein [Candidatus Aminicenantes bacterium]|nr:HAD hydrolase family protein [Candidatus Aminicenantes bacterium]
MKAEDRAKKIKMILMDVDGTLTDGSLLVFPDGEELKTYDVKDGTGILLAHLAGIQSGIITGKRSKALEKRAETLRITELHQGILDKKESLQQILKKQNFQKEEVAYIGDDLGDLEVIKEVGLAGAVGDAHHAIKKHSHFVCSQPGGKGAVREFIEFIITSQKLWPEIKKRYFEFLERRKG